MLEFVLTEMTHTYAQSRDNSNTFIIIQLQTLLEEGLINFRILFLETAKLFEFRKVESKMFHSVIVEGRKEFLKKLCLILKQGMLSTFLVAYECVFSGISLKRYWGLLFL